MRAAALARRTALGGGAAGGPPPAHSWFKADALSLSNLDPVATWADSSGNGHDATQATGASRPLYRSSFLNGLAVVEFDGSQYLQQAAFSALGQPNTVIVVAKSNVTSGPCLFDGLDGSHRHLAYMPDSSAWNWGAGAFIAGGTPDTSWHIRSYVFNTTAGQAYVDGVAAGAAGDVGANSLTGLTIGAVFVAILGWNGYIAELLLFSGALSSADHNSYGSGLAAKWGLSWTTIP